ncbi:SDR family oxidoreductase [Streptomyces sp. NPDC090442]|uniref:SDR family oxidoreductase n=1 Tax=Streptomyces sp. NPDC090442 TaxID=3365962 RepID=UPI003814F35B
MTGASSGLGRACALHLARLGFQVFAGVRKQEDGDTLAAEADHGRLHPVILDVTDEASVTAAATQVSESVSGVWAVVNNAGSCLSAPLESVRPEQLRRQLDVNVVGPLAVAQAFLPQLRRSGGRIVNVTPGLGQVALPYLGAYATGQFAKEGLSDAFRRELRPEGIDVILVQPGAIATPIWEKVQEAGQDVLDVLPTEVAERYRPSFERFLKMNEQRAQASRTTPEHYARTIAEALTAAHPRTRYRVGPDATLAAVLGRALPDRILDQVLASLTAQETKGGSGLVGKAHGSGLGSRRPAGRSWRRRVAGS